MSDKDRICPRCWCRRTFTTDGQGQPVEDAHTCSHGNDCHACEDCDWIEALITEGPAA